MAKSKGRESNTGLVVTLVFFILASIGLGVATYYGFTQQADLTTKANAAAASEKEAEKERDWYKFQAWTFRSYLGQTEGVDDTTLKVYRDQFDANQMGKDAAGKDYPDRKTVADAIAAVEKEKYAVAKDDKTPAPLMQMAWDKDKKRPAVTFQDVVRGLTAMVKYQEAQTANALTAQATAEAAAKKSDEENVADHAARKAEVDNLSKRFNEDVKKALDANAGLRDDLAKANDEKNAAVQKGADDVKAVQKGIAAKDTKIRDLEGRLTDLNGRLETAAKTTADAPQNGKPIPTDWRIVAMDSTGKKPFINLGTADNIHPPLTFSIHGKGPDGKPLTASKGSLEVIDVMKDHLAQAQVVSVKDSFKDPILPGDFLYNPIFNPTAEQHVVIAGRVDMHGVKGADDLEEFERLLKRQNVVVDGYVDPTDGSIKGKLGVGTDYLILGDVDAAKDASAPSIKTLQDQARANGVRIISVREFLESIGYRRG